MKIRPELAPEIIAKYQAGASSYTLGKEYNTYHNRILNLLAQNGIQRRKTGEGLRKWAVDESFFDVLDTEEKAYWLGFLFADGSVHQGGTTRRGKDPWCLLINLAAKDREILERLKLSLKSTYPVTVIAKSKHPMVTLRIVSAKLCTSLVKHGCVPQKTQKELHIPEAIPHDLIPHFIRGYFDGDGYVGISRGHLAVCFVAHTSTLLREFQQIMAEKGLRFCLCQSSGGAFRLNCLGRSSRLFGCWIYEGATVYLARKRTIFEQGGAFLQKSLGV